MAKSSELQTPVVLSPTAPLVIRERQTWYSIMWQLVRFGIVGAFNTGIDILFLNLLLLAFPTHNANLLLAYNSLAYTLGAINSFYLNKYWTFKKRRTALGSEALRFLVMSLFGIICNDGLLWSAARVLHPLVLNNFLWANMSKAVAVLGTAIISYLGMRLWVFAGVGEMPQDKQVELVELELVGEEQPMQLQQSLSIVMPAHNEEVAIRSTMQSVLNAVSQWTQDFEIIVVNDGSKDDTRAILEAMAIEEPRIRVLTHEVNQGYGAALVTGFEATTKDLVFFMDSDGQFDIRDLARFFPLITQYDAVLGYRIHRQDTWLRKLNAWGWKMLVRLVFKLRVRDIDCAFKLYKGEFFRTHRLETRGAMINTEILYQFTRAGYTYTEVGVHHLPRRGGKATGAKLSVIARAFLEMFTYARKWNSWGQRV